MSTALFFVIGVTLLWFIPGAIAAIICLASHRLRTRALQLHRASVDHAIAEAVRKGGFVAETAIQSWKHIRDGIPLAYVCIAFVLTLSGPLAIGRLRDLSRASAEIRLE